MNNNNPYSNDPIVFSRGDNQDYNENNSNHESDSVAEYEVEDQAQHGKQESRGFDKHNDNSVRNKGYHDDDHQNHYYDQNNKNTASGHDDSDQYGKQYNIDDGENGGMFEEKKAHKKGSKTKGYHNVFHKDEYKKGR